MLQYRYDITQNSEEWFEIKVAKFSASTAADLLMDKKNKGYQNLINRIIEERITGKQTESKSFVGNQYTERGHEFEPIARDDYEFRSFNDVAIIGVIELDKWVLCSPDGLIGEKGLYQAKCPIFNTQREYLHKYKELKEKGLSDNAILYKIDSGYYKQMQFELFVSGREFNVFNSYHPHLPALDLTVIRDNDMIDAISERIKEAKREILTEIKYLKTL